MESYKVKNIDLASKGFRQIEWASEHMPVLNQINNRFEQEKPLEGLTLAACLHITKETAVLVNTLLSGGANIALCGSNPLSTQDHVAAALAEKGTHVYAWREQTKDQYYWCIERVVDHQPKITLDDGADLVGTLHSKRLELLSEIRGGTEETTTGIQRLKAMDKKGALKYPIIAVNDAFTKYLFDNRFGTGQSTIDGILRTTNILLAGKNFVVSGYGWCGRGIAMRARGMGAKVIVTEVDPIRAMEAVLNGFSVMQMSKAAEIGDIFVTVTGNTHVIRKEHVQKMKSGAILANSGHFNVEINIEDLNEITTVKRTIRDNLDEYIFADGRKLYLLADGRLVNLAAAEGHPSEVMDMSFANQALSVEYLVKNKKLSPNVHPVPKEIDESIAKLKLEAMKIRIDDLTDEQKKYLAAWEGGT